MTSATTRKSAQPSEANLAQSLSSDDISRAAFADAATGAFIRRFDLPLAIVAPSGQVLWATDSARRRLRAPLPVFIEGGQLHFADTAGGSVSDRLSLFGEERRHALCGDISSGEWVLMWGWVERIRGQRVFALAFRPARPLSSCEESGLAEQFCLTKGECAVVDRFARMEAPKKIAENLGVAVDTVRTHLKRVHAKVGASSNVQLLQIVRAYCDA